MIRWTGYLGVAICLLLVPRVTAGVEFQAPTADELEMTSEPMAPGAPAIIFYRQVDRVDDAHGHEDNYLRIKSLTEEGGSRGMWRFPSLRDNERS